MQEQQKPKSLFAPMRPKIDTALVDRLLAQAEARKSEAAVAPVTQPTKTEPVKKATVPRVAPVHVEPITVSLKIEIVDDLGRCSPCWGYVRPFVLGAALNKAYEPTQSAIATRDFAQLRWLVMLAIATRTICQHYREPKMRTIIRYLWKLVERPPDTDWDAMSVAFGLSRHPVSEGIKRIDWEASDPQPFGSFVVGEHGKTKK